MLLVLLLALAGLLYLAGMTTAAILVLTVPVGLWLLVVLVTAPVALRAIWKEFR